MFVFDGATPEIKLKEINARRKRKLQWLGGEDDGGEQAAKKMARKLLVSKLRQGKELELSMSLARGDSKQPNRSGLALAPGFMLDDEVNGQRPTSQLDSDVPPIRNNDTSNNSIDAVTTVNIDREETVEIIESSDEEEEQLVLFPEENGEVNLDIQALTSLPPKMLFVIETAKRELRIKSRKEFMSVATDPLEYSNTQLKSFLKTISLNKQIKNAAIQSQRELPISEDGERGNGRSGKPKLDSGKPKPNTLFSSFAADDGDIADCWSEGNNSRYDDTKPNGDEFMFTSMDHTDDIHTGILNNMESSYPTVEKTLYEDNNQYIHEPIRTSQHELDTYDSEQRGGFLAMSESETNYDYTDQGGGFIPVNETSHDSSSVRYMSSVTNLYDESDTDILNDERSYRSHAQIAESHRSITESANQVTGNSKEMTWNPRADGIQFPNKRDSLLKVLQSNDSTNYVEIGDGIEQHIPSRTEKSTAKLFSADDKVESLSSGCVEQKGVSNTESSDNISSSLIEKVDSSLLQKTKVTCTSDDFLDSPDDFDVEWEDGEDEEKSILSEEGEMACVDNAFNGEDAEKSILSEEGETASVDNAFNLSYQSALKRNEWTDPIADFRFKDDGENLSGSIHIMSSPQNQSIDKADTCNPQVGANLKDRIDLCHSPPGASLNERQRSVLSQSTEFEAMNRSEERISSPQKIDSEAEQPPTSMISPTTAFTATNPSGLSSFDISLEGLQRQEGELRDEWNKYLRDTDYATEEHIDEIKHLIQLFGIPIIQAPAEAEAQCAAMEKMGFVDGVVTEDSDALVFGADSVYKNIFDDKMFVEVYHSKELKKLGLSKNELIALAMLLGGDYTDGVKGVGIVNGMEIIKAFPMEESVKDGLSNFRQWLESDEVSFLPGSPQEIFHLKHLSARLRWTTPKDFPSPNVLHAYTNPVVDRSEVKLSWDQPDVPALKLFCKRKMGWTEGRKLYAACDKVFILL